MSAFAHSRSTSQDTASSASSYQHMLEHILSYPGTYEIPLRTMYTLNCAPRAQPLPHQLTRTGSPGLSAGPSPTNTQCSWQENQATQQFTSSLMTQISQLPSQPCSLPPAFITSFVRRCFPSELVMVDFPQALTGLDYLKDLETRRRREQVAALHRLGIERDTFGSDADDVTHRFPGVIAWIKLLDQKDRKAEAFYTQLYIALRRWILINELSLLPFNKHNCVAMLNTLYPPVVSSQPTPRLTATILKQQRDGFFRYIQGVERSGPRILDNLMLQGKRDGDENGWMAVRETLEMYLIVANNIISDCQQITDVKYFAPAEESGNRKGRKFDSGVSFNSDSRPSTSDGKGDKSRPLSPTTTRPKTPSTPGKTASALEKIAREFRKMRRSKPEVEEMVHTSYDEQEKPRLKGLRKMRSLGVLGDLRQAHASTLSFNGKRGNSTSVFDVDEMRRQRLLYEAKASISQRIGGQRAEAQEV
ncbi:hypothetical protein LTR04_000864 [Oleoguttula sp. CCFEE 6159]|nr:hypothetical protein LTR04_000864 [Oleoguttula sp. CCFEE 6159]